MPIYEYECNICEHVFERKQRFDEEPVALCPQCDGKAKRVLCSVPIIFKGSGFYCTDNRSNTNFNEGTEAPKGKQKGKEASKGKQKGKEAPKGKQKKKEQVGGESTTTTGH
jgi:putative FmdB family regulatory protein